MAQAPAPVDGLTLEALERVIAELGAGLCSRMARWLGLIAEFDRRDGAHRWGFRGTAEWLAWRCGIGARAAREHVRVARRLRDLPLVAAAFAAGELSYSKVRAVTRACDSEDERSLLEAARVLTADRLEHTIRGLRTASSASIEEANRARDRRTLDWWWAHDGSLQLSGRLAPDDGAALVEALETAAEALHGAPAAAEPQAVGRRPPLGARRADALAEMAHSGCPRSHVVLHVDAPALACTATSPQARAGDVCRLREGPAVPSETARRLACDSVVSMAVAKEDGGVDHGRARRVVSPALRTTLERRDGGCRFPGCTRRHGLHAHHVEHWAHGGATNRDNLVLLCRFHHRLVHEDGFAVRNDQGTFSFRRPDGRLVSDLPPPVMAAA
jgi:hypothetical protein